MNLAEALDVLPEITTPTKRKRIFKIDPRLVGREHIEEDGPIFLAHVPGSVDLFRLTPEQWKLAHLFDGERSNAEIAGLFLSETAIQLSEDDVQSFAETMEDSNFWYQSPQEKNAALMQKLRDRRKKQKKAKAGDMAHIVVAHRDGIDNLLPRHPGLVGDAARRLHSRSCLQGRLDRGNSRRPHESQPADQARWLLRLVGNSWYRRDQGALYRAGNGLGAETHF